MPIAAEAVLPALVRPHGGALVERLVPEEEEGALAARAERLPGLVLDARELADLELLATGAASPLRGFLGRADYESVLERMRLADGTVWPIPFTLATSPERAHALAGAGELALRDPKGRLWGTLKVTDRFVRDPLREARAVYGTEDPGHPGVAYLLSRPTTLLGGDVSVLPLPRDLPFAAYRLSPRALRERISALGWREAAAFQTRNPIHRAHEHLTKVALEVSDGIVIHPLVGETKGDDVPASVRFRAYEALVRNYYPENRTILAAFPAAMRYAGPREALFHALVRKNYGIRRLIVGRDHAGVGGFYAPDAAHTIFDRFTQEEIGVEPLRFAAAFFCRACDTLASARTCPHDASSRLDLSGSRVRELLRSGRRLPPEFTRPETAEILREHYAGASPGGRSAGFILWLTGLSGAGKSTLAAGLKSRFPKTRLEVLDGDEVRTNLSAGLGFSKEDRDTNIRRIGFVARLLARNGVGVVAAAISPYAAARDEVRQASENEGVPFLEVFVEAPIEVLAGRDVKGLYRKALAGEVPHFTGVSDPYEAPVRPDLAVRTDQESVEESLERIEDLLRARGLVRGHGELERAS
jgi:sulfate adenylyltransferase